MDLFAGAGLGPGTFADGAVQIRVGRAQVVYSRGVTSGEVVELRPRVLEILHPGRMTVNIVLTTMGAHVGRARMTVAFVDADSGRLVNAPAEVWQTLGPQAARLRPSVCA